MNDRIENQTFNETGNKFSDSIVITDANGLIEWTNHAFHMLCGYSKKEVMGSRPGDFLQGENTNPETVRALHDARVKGEYINTEILNYHKNGHPYWASISITPIRDDDDKLIGFISVERDITEQRRQAAEMEKQIVEVYTALLSSEKFEADGPPSDDPFVRELT